jgi:hypothetical protein
VNSQHVYFWNQLWLIVVTLTATGYGDLYPITHLGRLICCIAMVVGAFLLAVLTATVRHTCTATCPRFRSKIRGFIDCFSTFHLVSAVWHDLCADDQSWIPNFVPQVSSQLTLNAGESRLMLFLQSERWEKEIRLSSIR